MRLDSGAFSQLTRKYMLETFNPQTPDVEGVRFVPLRVLSPCFMTLTTKQATSRMAHP
jgi:hypothetical protein